MFKVINDIENDLFSYVREDPVRPEIPSELRVGKNKFVCAIEQESMPLAMICVNLLDSVPMKTEELFQDSKNPEIAVFYSVWSYVPGKASILVFETVKEIKEKYPTVKRFVTLSPKTEMAKRFHLKNGAEILQENETTVNYEYRRV